MVVETALLENDINQSLDFNKLKEDMDWINRQIENETPSRISQITRQCDTTELFSTPACLNSEINLPSEIMSASPFNDMSPQIHMIGSRQQ